MKDDKFEMGTGQAHELAMAFGRNGWTNADIKKLSEGENLIEILSVLRGDIELTPVKSYSRTFAPELIPKRWLVMPGEVAPSEFDVSKLKLGNPFFRVGAKSISGEEVRKIAVEVDCSLGLVDGKRILAEPNKIPAEFKRYRILLPGTVLCSPDGKRYFPCLQYDSDHEPGLSWSRGMPWSIGSYYIDGDFQSYLFRFACIR